MGHKARQSEGTAYIDRAGGVWEARWYSRDEGRYYTIARKGTQEEAVAAATKAGFKPVVISTGLSGRTKASKRPVPISEIFVRAYLEAALWASSVPDGDEPLDAVFGIDDFSKEAFDQAVRECNDFIKSNRKDLESVGTEAQHGHDFWLTRNRHGAGFWDRGYGAVGKRLTDNAHAYGQANAYAGEDGVVRFE